MMGERVWLIQICAPRGWYYAGEGGRFLHWLVWNAWREKKKVMIQGNVKLAMKRLENIFTHTNPLQEILAALAGQGCSHHKSSATQACHCMQRYSADLLCCHGDYILILQRQLEKLPLLLPSRSTQVWPVSCPRPISIPDKKTQVQEWTWID